MRNFRLLIIALATICMLALGVFAIANRPVPEGGDDIIIKGGSLEIQCGKNHGTRLFGYSRCHRKVQTQEKRRTHNAGYG